MGTVRLSFRNVSCLKPYTGISTKQQGHKGRLRKMEFGNIKKARFFIAVIALVLLAGGLPSHLPIVSVPPVHAMPPSATSCATTDCPVSQIVNGAFAFNRGNIASEAKIDQIKAYSDGATTVYGDTKPSIYIGLMARLSNDARNGWNPNFNLRTLSITVTITDSSGNVFSPQVDSNGHAPVSTTFWYTPSPSTATDASGTLFDLANWFGSFFLPPLPTLPPLIHPTVLNGVSLNPNTIVGQWTDWGFNYPDNTLRCGIPCGSNPTVTDKSIELNIVPQFTKADVYTISVSTHAEQGDCTQGNFPPLTIVCQVDDKQDQSYSFNYVYENDAGLGGDAADSLPNAGGSPGFVGHGSNTGLLYGIDTTDIYAFTATQSEKVSFVVTPNPTSDFGLTIYDASQPPIQIGSQDLGTGQTNFVEFTASAAGGTYFAKISFTGGTGGTYSISLSDQFMMSAQPNIVSLGLTGTGSSTTSTIGLQSPGDFSGQVTLSTSVTPAVPNAPTVTLSTVTATATVQLSPSVVVATYWSPSNPSYAFASDGNYASFDTANGGGATTVCAIYGGYSLSPPSGAAITDIKILAKHHETGDQYSVWDLMEAGGKQSSYNILPYRSSDATDSVDETSLLSSWTADTINNAHVWYCDEGGVYHHEITYLDWLPLQVTYNYPTTTSTLTQDLVTTVF